LFRCISRTGNANVAVVARRHVAAVVCDAQQRTRHRSLSACLFVTSAMTGERATSPGGIRRAANATGGSPIVTRVDDAESDPGGGSVRSCSGATGPGGDLRRRAGRGFRVRNAAGERIGMGIGRLVVCRRSETIAETGSRRVRRYSSRTGKRPPSIDGSRGHGVIVCGDYVDREPVFGRITARG
jgi:hypothetical protein